MKTSLPTCTLMLVMLTGCSTGQERQREFSPGLTIHARAGVTLGLEPSSTTASSRPVHTLNAFADKTYRPAFGVEFFPSESHAWSTPACVMGFRWTKDTPLPTSSGMPDMPSALVKVTLDEGWTLQKNTCPLDVALQMGLTPAAVQGLGISVILLDEVSPFGTTQSGTVFPALPDRLLGAAMRLGDTIVHTDGAAIGFPRAPKADDIEGAGTPVDLLLVNGSLEAGFYQIETLIPAPLPPL